MIRISTCMLVNVFFAIDACIVGARACMHGRHAWLDPGSIEA